MERKLVKQGENALTITLPAKWLKEKGLKAGDTVNIEEKTSQLIVSSTKASKITETSIDLEGKRAGLSYRRLITKYIEGYDIITISNYKEDKLENWIQERLTGFIVESKTSKIIKIKNIISKPEDNFKSIFNRILFILKEQTQNLDNSEKTKKTERKLDTNIIYCLRYIKKYQKTENPYKFYSALLNIEALGDKISKISKIKTTKKQRTKIINLIEKFTKELTKKDVISIIDYTVKQKESNKQKTFFDGILIEILQTIDHITSFYM
jgi:antitoxin component of MazEF toxin-antitoxin module